LTGGALLDTGGSVRAGAQDNIRLRRQRMAAADQGQTQRADEKRSHAIAP